MNGSTSKYHDDYHYFSTVIWKKEKENRKRLPTSQPPVSFQKIPQGRKKGQTQRNLHLRHVRVQVKRSRPSEVTPKPHPNPPSSRRRTDSPNPPLTPHECTCIPSLLVTSDARLHLLSRLIGAYKDTPLAPRRSPPTPRISPESSPWPPLHQPGE